jgi:hypothetical protein
LHQTRDLVSGTIRTRREEDVTGEHEEWQVCTSSAILIKRSELVRQKPLCALVDARLMQTNTTGSSAEFKMYWDQLSAEQRPVSLFICNSIVHALTTFVRNTM